jgi:hypothetical protein
MQFFNVYCVAASYWWCLVLVVGWTFYSVIYLWRASKIPTHHPHDQKNAYVSTYFQTTNKIAIVMMMMMMMIRSSFSRPLVVHKSSSDQ